MVFFSCAVCGYLFISHPTVDRGPHAFYRTCTAATLAPPTYLAGLADLPDMMLVSMFLPQGSGLLGFELLKGRNINPRVCIAWGRETCQPLEG